MTRKALIIGVTGSFGGAVARALGRRGWHVRALARRPEQARGRVGPGLVDEWVSGDAMDAAAVRRAAAGVELIVHGANPPGYRNWRGLALPMLANTVAAAEAADARILFPCTVYNYGPDSWSRIREDSPQRPISRKGRIRVEMESLLRQAPVRSLILRAGDFFGGHGASSWFDAVLVKPGRPLRRVVYPGDREAGHAWAYLPDLADTAARLLEREAELARTEVFNFGGHYLPQGLEMAQAIRRASGRAELPVRRLPWPLLRLVAPFDETVREVLEMRYLWRHSVRLDDSKLRAVLGTVPHTPLDEAVYAALAGLGCLPAVQEALA